MSQPMRFKIELGIAAFLDINRFPVIPSTDFAGALQNRAPCLCFCSSSSADTGQIYPNHFFVLLRAALQKISIPPWCLGQTQKWRFLSISRHFWAIHVDFLVDIIPPKYLEIPGSYTGPKPCLIRNNLASGQYFDLCLYQTSSNTKKVKRGTMSSV